MKGFLLLRNIGFCLLCIFLLAFQGLLFAGTTGKIAGNISDAQSGEPLAGVNVVIEGTTMGSATDLEGDYFIVNVPPGTYTVTASMVGYTTVNTTNVNVIVDRTVSINFSLQSTVLEGEAITVVAERDVIPMDVSSSQISAQSEQIMEVPLVVNIDDYINLQAGIQDGSIRGGTLDQIGFVLDGMEMNDNRSNKPVMAVNLSTVQEINVIKGGFNAEYGNIRSGLINVVTKEGSPSRYHGSLDTRYTAPYQKHKGPSIISPDNYWHRPFLDPDVSFVGTSFGWDQEKQKQNESFVGWNKVSQQLLADDDPSNDKTPEECRDMYLWEQAMQGSEKFGQRLQEYGENPDWQADLSVGGPVPAVGEMLGDLSFFASYRTRSEQFPRPNLRRPEFREQNYQLKLTSRLSPTMKLQFEGVYGKINTLHRGSQGEDTQDDDWFRSGDEMLAFMGGGRTQLSGRGKADIHRNVQGIAFDHVINPGTFYNIRFSRIEILNRANAEGRPRDLSPKYQFGSTWVDERPWGHNLTAGRGNESTIGDGRFHTTIGNGLEDSSEVRTYNLKFDLTSQIDKFNQVKIGVNFTYDDLKSDYWFDIGQQNAYANLRRSTQTPWRMGLYLQDKLEWEGMIANLGLRLDYSNPNSDWYDLDPYSFYFKKEYRDNFEQLAPKTSVQEKKWRLSPRFGISHPIGETAKIYFNYGHFYSMPLSAEMYALETYEKAQGITHLGNPYADPPKTVAYELGFEFNVFQEFLVSLAGYYKDVTDQTGRVQYTNFDESVDYTTVENNNYEDIRGAEITLERRFGQWVTGFINYTYEVSTSGFLGRRHYFQDVREQQRAGLQDPQIERTLARPFARANITIRTPSTFGPTWGNINPIGDLSLGWLASYRAGRYFTWNPLEIFGLQNNLQWEDYYSVDLRISKRLRLGRTNITLFADVVNVFDLEFFSEQAFRSNQDREDYLRSLHLPMYDDFKYRVAGLTPGEDTPGDLKSFEKYYIDNPNIDHLYYLNPRNVWFGVTVDF